MNNIAKFLALGVFAASTTLVAHATPVSGSIGFSDTCSVVVGGVTQEVCGLNVNTAAGPLQGSGDLVFGPTGTVGSITNVGGINTFSAYFATGGTVNFFNTNGSQTDFGPVCTDQIAQTGCSIETSSSGPGVIVDPVGGGVKIASVDNGSEILTYYVLTSETTNASATSVSLMGTGYFTETCDPGVTVGCTNYTITEAGFSLGANSAGGPDTFSIGGTAFSTSATPEPSSLMLLGTGLVSAAGVVFRRRRSVA
jgi:PEP-CTERM motif